MTQQAKPQLAMAKSPKMRARNWKQMSAVDNHTGDISDALTITSVKPFCLKKNADRSESNSKPNALDVKPCQPVVKSPYLETKWASLSLKHTAFGPSIQKGRQQVSKQALTRSSKSCSVKKHNCEYQLGGVESNSKDIGESRIHLKPSSLQFVPPLSPYSSPPKSPARAEARPPQQNLAVPLSSFQADTVKTSEITCSGSSSKSVSYHPLHKKSSYGLKSTGMKILSFSLLARRRQNQVKHTRPRDGDAATTPKTIEVFVTPLQRPADAMKSDGCAIVQRLPDSSPLPSYRHSINSQQPPDRSPVLESNRHSVNSGVVKGRRQLYSKSQEQRRPEVMANSSGVSVRQILLGELPMKTTIHETSGSKTKSDFVNIGSVLRCLDKSGSELPRKTTRHETNCRKGDFENVSSVLHCLEKSAPGVASGMMAEKQWVNSASSSRYACSGIKNTLELCSLETGDSGEQIDQAKSVTLISLHRGTKAKGTHSTNQSLLVSADKLTPSKLTESRVRKGSTAKIKSMSPKPLETDSTRQGTPDTKTYSAKLTGANGTFKNPLKFEDDCVIKTSSRRPLKSSSNLSETSCDIDYSTKVVETDETWKNPEEGWVKTAEAGSISGVLSCSSTEGRQTPPETIDMNRQTPTDTNDEDRQAPAGGCDGNEQTPTYTNNEDRHAPADTDALKRQTPTDTCCDVNGQTTPDANAVNRQTAADTSDVNRQTAADTSDVNRQTAADTSDVNRQTAADTSDVNRQTAADTSDVNRQTAADTSDVNRQTAADTSDVNRQTAADTSDVNRQTAADTSDVNRQTAADTSDVNRQTAADTSDVNRQTAADTSDVNRQTAADTSDVNRQTAADTSDVNRQTAADTSDVNRQTAADTSDVNRQTAADTSDVNRQTAADTSDVNGQTTAGTSDVDRQTTDDTSDVDRQTTDDTSDGGLQTTADTRDEDRQATADTGDENRQSTADTSDKNRQTAAETDRKTAAGTSNVNRQSTADTSDEDRQTAAETDRKTAAGTSNVNRHSTGVRKEIAAEEEKTCLETSMNVAEEEEPSPDKDVPGNPPDLESDRNAFVNVNKTNLNSPGTLNNSKDENEETNITKEAFYHQKGSDCTTDNFQNQSKSFARSVECHDSTQDHNPTSPVANTDQSASCSGNRSSTAPAASTMDKDNSFENQRAQFPAQNQPHNVSDPSQKCSSARKKYHGQLQRLEKVDNGNRKTPNPTKSKKVVPPEDIRASQKRADAKVKDVIYQATGGPVEGRVRSAQPHVLRSVARVSLQINQRRSKSVLGITGAKEPVRSDSRSPGVAPDGAAGPLAERQVVWFMALWRQCLANHSLSKLQPILRRMPHHQRRQLTEVESNDASGPMLVACCMLGDATMVDFLLDECGACIEKQGTVVVPAFPDNTAPDLTFGASALWCAAVSGHQDVVKTLLRHGADVNFRTSHGSSPLRSACFASQVDTARVLIEAGADIHAPNHTGSTCLINSVHWGGGGFASQVDTASVLIEAGADIHAPNHTGSTCLINSVHCPELVRLLLMRGARPNDCDHRGNVALHYAAGEGHLRSVKLLIQFGGDCRRHNHNAVNVLQHCAARGWKHIADHIITETHAFKYIEAIEAYELLGCGYVESFDRCDLALEEWKNALMLRSTLFPKRNVRQERITAFNDRLEFSSLQDLEAMASNPSEVRIQSLLVMERIFGKSNKELTGMLLTRANAYFSGRQFRPCLELYKHTLSIQLSADHPLSAYQEYTVHRTVGLILGCEGHIGGERESSASVDDCLHILQLLVELLQKAKVALSDLRTAPHPKDCRCSVCNRTAILTPHCVGCGCHRHAEKGAETYLILLVFALHLIRLVATHVHLSPPELHRFRSTVYRLLKADHRTHSGDTILHLCFPLCDIRGAGTFIMPTLPLLETLIECGADVDALNDLGESPLFAIFFGGGEPKVKEALLSHCDRDSWVRLLVRHGAHVDRVALCGGESLIGALKRQDNNFCTLSHTSLQCLAARAVRSGGIAYDDPSQLPRDLIHFVSFH